MKTTRRLHNLPAPRGQRLFQLNGALTALGSTSAKWLTWNGTSWSASTSTFTVYDFAGFTGTGGDKGVAFKVYDHSTPIWVVGSMIPQARLDWAHLYKDADMTLGTTYLTVVGSANTGGNGGSLSANGAAGTITINTLGDYYVYANAYVDLAGDTTTNMQASIGAEMYLVNWSASYGHTNLRRSSITVPAGFTTHQVKHEGGLHFAAIGKSVAAGTVLSTQVLYYQVGVTMTANLLKKWNFGAFRL